MYHFTVMTSLFNTLTPNKMSSLDIFLHYHNTHLNASQPNQSSPAAYNSLPQAARWVITVPNEIQCSVSKPLTLSPNTNHYPINSGQLGIYGVFSVWVPCPSPSTLSISFPVVVLDLSLSLSIAHGFHQYLAPPLYFPLLNSIFSPSYSSW